MKDLCKIIQNQPFFTKKDRLLLGLSGGVDSMVLADVLLKTGFNFVIAHCNYMLRGDESLYDELFVKEFAEKNKLAVHTLRKRPAAGNIQATARQIRYDFFTSLDKKYHFDFIITAHHADDKVETFFLQMLRGAHLKAMANMEMLNGKLCRPLIELRKNEILQYAKHNKIIFREDRTNISSAYNRNYIRNEIIPLLEKRFPQASDSILHALFRLQLRQNHFDSLYSKWLDKSVETKAHELVINKKYTKDKVYLFEFLNFQGFHIDQIKKILENINKTGSVFVGKNNWHLLIASKELILYQEFQSHDHSLIFTVNHSTAILDNEFFNIRISEISATLNKAKSGNINSLIYLDAEKIKWPINIRKWKPGDSIKPLGLKNHHKKVQDILTDAKISKRHKQRVWLIEDSSEICWLIGHCQNESHKITNQSRRMICIEWSQND